ncbi:MAG: T9SS type A sorting domain-containing protein [Chitinophagaceae bacterium]|nr:MAG: T9SS type A sorting domain-containing protein [Chitinophagaceae bacterium]
MQFFKPLSLLVATMAISLCAFAQRPINGTSNFNTVPAGVRISGNATGAGITATNIAGFNFRLTTTNPPTMVVEVWDGTVSTGNGVAFYEESSIINPPISAITITSADGALFDLLSIGINGQASTGGSANVTITGLNSSGVPIAGATTSGTASVSSLTAFNVGGNTAFKAIAAIRITSANLVYAFIDNISLANVGTVLPLSGLEFSATPKNNSVLLNWSTESEQATRSFTVEHSVDGSNWSSIGSIAAAGSSSTKTLYQYTHSTPARKGNYYRLTQQDLSGRKTISNIIYLDISGQSVALSVYPNIAVGGFVNVQLQEACNIRVFNNAGVLVLQKTLPAGVSQVELSKHPAGLYYIKAGNQTASIVIQ